MPDMLRTIWKYPLNTNDVQHLSMPLGAIILTVQMQKTPIVSAPIQPVLWADVDPKAPLQSREIFCRQTGARFSAATYATYIATVQNNGIVAHYFQGR